jgi:hypothetical protein
MSRDHGEVFGVKGNEAQQVHGHSVIWRTLMHR